MCGVKYVFDVGFPCIHSDVKVNNITLEIQQHRLGFSWDIVYMSKKEKRSWIILYTTRHSCCFVDDLMEEHELIRFYFFTGFTYVMIQRLLAEYHDIHISQRFVFTDTDIWCMNSPAQCYKLRVCLLLQYLRCKQFCITVSIHTVIIIWQ